MPSDLIRGWIPVRRQKMRSNKENENEARFSKIGLRSSIVRRSAASEYKPRHATELRRCCRQCNCRRRPLPATATQLNAKHEVARAAGGLDAEHSMPQSIRLRLSAFLPFRQICSCAIAVAAAMAPVCGHAAPAVAQIDQPARPAAEAAKTAPAAVPPAGKSVAESKREAGPRGGAAEGQTAQDHKSSADRTNLADKKLPAAVTTEQKLDLPGRTLRFQATAGAIPLFDADSGKLRAEMAYIAYTIGEPTAGRPVTFVFNGGPGASSAYLNIGALGPWRLPLDHITASAPSRLTPNAETWLDFTDLVFIDPPGTGYSRLAGGDGVRRQFWSVDGDADAIAVFIRKWIAQNQRQQAAKFLVGESYGGVRALKVARVLEQSQGVGVRGLVLLSPVLDFTHLSGRRHAPMTFVDHLPSMAATAQALAGKFDRSSLAAVEAYAKGDYLADLMRGINDKAAIARMSVKLVTLTGLDEALIKQRAGRIDVETFRRELYRSRGLVGSMYDATVTAFDPTPTASDSEFPDPVLDATQAPLTSAMTDLYQNKLNWRVEQPYRVLNGGISSRWNWGRGRRAPQVVDELRTVLASDRLTQVLIAHGASDLVTPYFANKLILEQLPVYGSPRRARLNVYGGGHMFYSRDASRRELRDDAEALYRTALSPEPAGE